MMHYLPRYGKSGVIHLELDHPHNLTRVSEDIRDPSDANNLP